MPLLASAFGLPPIALPWLSLVLALPLPFGLAMDSPWWENDDRKDRFRWDHQQELVLERNVSQLTQPMATLLHCQRTEDV